MSTKQYELTGETIGPSSAPLHRIRATRDIPRQGVREGDIGGWTGNVDGLADEVENRAADWHATEAEKERWRAEYAALETLVRARITAWSQENTND